MAKGKFTIDHETIRRWAEERDGHPARVKAAGKKKSSNGRAGGLLRIDFGEPEASLETISREEFFEAFEENNLAFLYQDEIDGKKSRFFKFVDRDSVADKAEGEAGEDEKEDEEDDEDDDAADDLEMAANEVENGGGEDEDDEEEDEDEEEE